MAPWMPVACGAREEYPRRAGSNSASGTDSERAKGRKRLLRGSPPRARVLWLSAEYSRKGLRAELSGYAARMRLQ
jgi:hypothetical protein